MAAAFLVLGGGSARAAVLEVKVPFPFVVHGQTLPAGQYRIEREGSDVGLIRGEKGTKGAAFLVTMPASGHDPAGETPALTFTPYENTHRLAGIWESGNQGYAVTRSQAERDRRPDPIFRTCPVSGEPQMVGWLARIRAEYREMPGLRLTEPQVRRLWSLDADTCSRVLGALVREHFLARTAGGNYMLADRRLGKSWSGNR